MVTGLKASAGVATKVPRASPTARGSTPLCRIQFAMASSGDPGSAASEATAASIRRCPSVRSLSASSG